MGRRAGIAGIVIAAGVIAPAVGAPPSASEPLRPSATFASGPAFTPLIEAYTSEGCSSCPVADRWMSGLVDRRGLWTDFVPVSFHVDFWDYLGWKDSFAQEKFGDRLHWYVILWREGSAVTPTIVVDGRHDRRWRRGADPVFEREPDPQAGVLRAEYRGENQIDVRFDSEQDGEILTAHAALLGFGIRRPIGRGENRDRVLIHDFTALAYAAGDLAQTTNGVWEGRVTLPDERPADTKRRGVAVWITGKNRIKTLQSAGGFLP